MTTQSSCDNIILLFEPNAILCSAMVIKMDGRIHSFESFGTVDGPGIRFVVFMQGCNLRCKYCHNPDTWNFDGGKVYTPNEVAETVKKYKNYFSTDGGITVSGGEPLNQIEFLTELFRILRKDGISTCVDTSGYPFVKDDKNVVEKFDELIKYTDLFLLDVKEIDDEKHLSLTGKSNKNTLDFAKYLSDNNKKMWIRYVLVPNLTDDEKDERELKKFIDGLKTVEKVEILPYHTLGKEKYKKLGLKYSLEDVLPPTKEEVEKAKEILIR